MNTYIQKIKAIGLKSGDFCHELGPVTLFTGRSFSGKINEQNKTMSYLKSIAAKGLMSGDFKHDLSRVTLFTGKSFSGKTSRIQTIRLGLIKYIPELGKNGAMMLARNGAFTIALTDDAGRKSVHEWNEKCKTGRAVNDEFAPTPAVLMDPSIYFELSDKKKIEYAFSMFKMDAKFSYAAVIERVWNELREVSDEKPNPEHEIKNIMDESAFESENILSQSVQEWIEALIVKMKARLSEANADAKRMTTTVQANVTLASAQRQHRNPAAELKQARENVTTLTASRAQQYTIQNQIEGLKTKRDAANAAVESSKVEPDATLDSRTEALRKEIEELDKPMAQDSQLETLQQDLDTISTFLETNGSKTETIVVQKATSGDLISILTGDRTSLLKEIKLATASHETAMKEGCCAHCGALSEHWSEDHSKAKLKKEFAKWLKEKTAAIAKLEERIESEKKVFLGLIDSLDAAKKADELLNKKRADAEGIRTRMNALRLRRETLEDARDKDLKRMRKELAVLVDAKAQEVRRADARKNCEDNLAAVVAELSKYDQEAIASNIANYTKEIEATAQNITILEQVERDYNRGQEEDKRNAKALLDQAKANAKIETTKAVISTLETIQAEMVTAAFDKILKTVNLVTSAVMPEPIEYLDGEIGRYARTSTTSATWITHATFSGTEKALVYCGLSLALAEKAPVRLILMDELGRLDEDSLRKVLERMIELTNTGVVDQFIGALSTQDDFRAMDGLTVIKL